MVAQDSLAEDLLACRPRLRADLRSTVIAAGGRTHHQFEDPLTARYYRLGPREWRCVESWDGNKTLAGLLAEAPPESDSERLGRADIVALYRWLQQAGLLDADRSAATSSSSPGNDPNREGFWANPVFLRLPLWNPDRALDRCLPWCAWTLAPAALVAWSVAVVAAICLVVFQWDQFQQPWATMLAPDRWLHLLVVWCGLKVVHEFYHGLACKRWGGRVTTCGVMFVFFSPVAYVDVTASWQFRSRWQRIMTAAAGMYAELFVASIATMVWSFSDEPATRQACHQVMWMAGVSTLLFNANFLMKYDGYFILSDLLDIQNLHGLGQLHVRDWTRRHLLGLRGSEPLANTRGAAWVRVYGWASFGWRLVFYAGVLFTASAMFHGAGIVLAVFIAVSWFLRPAWAMLRLIWRGRPGERPSRLRLTALVTAVAVLAVVVGRMPWPGGIRAYGVVDYENPCIVRAGCQGFVRNIHVRSGERVHAGQHLITMENPQLVQDLNDARTAVAQSRVRERMAASDHDVSQWQVERQRRESLERRCQELSDRVEQLTLVAPASGSVMAVDLDTLRGQYVALGTPLLELGNEVAKGVLLQVAQDDAERFASQIGASASVRVLGRRPTLLNGRLVRVHPQGSRLLTSPALGASQGGPLAVVPVADGSSSAVELLEPHFAAFLELPASEAASLRAGQIAHVRLDAEAPSVAGYLWKHWQRWMRGQLEATAARETTGPVPEPLQAADRRR